MKLLPSLLATAPLLFGTLGLPAADEPLPKIPIAMNLSAINDYTPGYPFRNLMWSARPWLTRLAEGGGPFDTQLAEKIPLDENGYPLSLPYAPEGEEDQVVFTIINKFTEPGEYVLLYDGEGEIGPAMNSRVVSQEPGRVILELTGGSSDSNYQGFAILRSTKGNHVRNIRILRPEDENTDLAAKPYTDEFIAYCAQWHALRFMDWQATNNSLEDTWEGRKKPSFYTMVGKGGDAIGRWGTPASTFDRLFSGGVALELLIQLANQAKVDPWFCVPHRATPEYMTEMAKLIKEKLDPSLKAYIEYSNEVWNWQFQQAGWMLQSKIAAEPLAGQPLSGWKDGVVPTEFPLDNGTVAREGGADHPERMGVLNRRAFKHFEEVFTGEDSKRIVRVIGVQQGWPDTARRTVEWVMENGGADAMSPAGYFGPNRKIYDRWAEAGQSLTVEQVLTDMQEIVDTEVRSWINQLAQIASNHNLRYIVYEGGQHIQPDGQKPEFNFPALREVQFSQGLYDVYMENFQLHQEAGCDLFAAFASFSPQGTQWGSWGHQEYLGQPREEIPKYGALLDVNTPKK